MRAFIRALADALARLPRSVFRACLEAGEWVWRLVAEQPSAPSVTPDVENELVEQRREDESIVAIREAARMLRSGQVPPQDVLARIRQDHVEWLLACTQQMLASIERADGKALRDQVAGRRSIRGVLITDPSTVAAFRRPVMTHEGLVDEDTLAWAPAL